MALFSEEIRGNLSSTDADGYSMSYSIAIRFGDWPTAAISILRYHF